MIIKIYVYTWSKQLPRDDYREEAEVTLVLLGCEPDNGKHCRQPGATHHSDALNFISHQSDYQIRRTVQIQHSKVCSV